MISGYEIKKTNYWLAGILVLSLTAALTVNLLLVPSMAGKTQTLSSTFEQLNEKCTKIYELDPSRIANAANVAAGKEFHYSSSVSEVAARWKIPTDKYNINVRSVMQTRDTRTQNARVAIEDVSVSTFAKFLSQILYEWPNLECQTIKLISEREQKDNWKATIDFIYTLN
jgi:hypothetical protein